MHNGHPCLQRVRRHVFTLTIFKWIIQCVLCDNVNVLYVRGTVQSQLYPLCIRTYSMRVTCRVCQVKKSGRTANNKSVLQLTASPMMAEILLSCWIMSVRKTTSLEVRFMLEEVMFIKISTCLLESFYTYRIILV